MNSSLFLKVLLAIGLAVATGLLAGPDASIIQVLHLVGQIFLNALKCVVLPLVISSLILGAARMAKEESFASLGKKVISTYVAVSFTAVLIGYGVVQLLQPGVGVHIPLASNVNLQSTTFQGFLMMLVPSNLLAAAAKGEMPGLVIFSLLFGFFSTKIKAEHGALIHGFFQGVFDIMLKITHLVMRLMPFGVFGMVSSVVATTGIEGVQSSLFFFCTVGLALILFATLALSLLLLSKGISPISHFRKVSPALLTAFSTCSSTLAMPIALDCMKKDYSISQFTIPLGASLSMAGTALNACVAVFFIAKVYAVDLSISDHLLIICMSVIASMGTGGIPSSCLIAVMIVLQTVGLPVEGVGMLLAVERFVDMLRSTTNIYGNTCCTAFVAGQSSEAEEAETTAS